MIKKHRLSIAGKYYVDKDSCICCAACAYHTPTHFKLDETDDGARVFKQPETLEEEAQCQEAKAACPVEAIFDDGK
jgi:ferredoxin